MRIDILFCLVLAMFFQNHEKQNGDEDKAFYKLAIAGKVMLGKLEVLSAPQEVDEVICQGTMSLQRLRFLAKSGNDQQRFWSIYCIGKMSRQSYDRDFLNSLKTSEIWKRKLSKENRTWMLQILDGAINEIGQEKPKPDQNKSNGSDKNKEQE